MDPQFPVISVRMDLLNIGLQKQLRTRNAIILGKSRNLELTGNHHTMNKTQIIKIQPGHFQIFHGIQTVFKLFVFVIFKRILLVVIVFLFVFRLTLVFCVVLDTSLTFDTLISEFYPADHSRTTFVTSAQVENTNDLLLSVDELLQILLALDQASEHFLELSILSLEIFDSLFKSHFC